ncbi:MAG: LysR family transcriptional regulator, partial [Burkholderiaceae bacterium]
DRTTALATDRRRMSIRSLRAVVAAADLGHFGRAAYQLGVPQATLSDQIALLEAQIGCLLFRRDARKVSLTAAGSAFVRDVRPALTLIEGATDNALRIARGEQGQLRVAACSAAMLDMVPALLQRLARSHPGLSVLLEERSSFEVEQRLLSGDVELGLLHPPLLHPGLRSVSLRDTPMVLAMPVNHRLAAREVVAVPELQGEHLLLPPRQSAPHLCQRIEGLLTREGISCTTEERNCVPGSLLSVVAAGRGVAFVPGSVVQAGRDGVAFRPLKGDPLSLGLALAWRAGTQSAAMQAAIAAAS